jgi:hypothetical protein
MIIARLVGIGPRLQRIAVPAHRQLELRRGGEPLQANQPQLDRVKRAHA